MPGTARSRRGDLADCRPRRSDRLRTGGAGRATVGRARVVEERDADDRTREIREIDTSVYAFAADMLRGGAGDRSDRQRAGRGNTSPMSSVCWRAAGEVGSECRRPTTRSRPRASTTGSSWPSCGRAMRDRLVEHWMRAGVTVVDPATTWMGVAGHARARRHACCPARGSQGATHIARMATVGPDCTLPDTTSARAHGLESHCDQGRDRRAMPPSGRTPTCARAPGSARGAKAGAYVEIKDADIGDGHQGAAPVLRRRRRDRRGQQHRRGHGVRQLRRGREAPDRRR